MKGPIGFAYPISPVSSDQKSDPSLPLRVRVITWNLGDALYTLDQWKQEIQKSWEFVTKQDFDVLAVCLQEDSRGKYGKLGDAIGSILSNNFTMISNSVEGPPEVSGQHFSVRAYMYARKSSFMNPTIRRNDVCLKRAVFCTKGTAGVSIITFLNSQILQITVMSSHLPISTSTEDLGYEERVQAVKKSMESVYDQLTDQTITKRIAFWAGDLNFRDSTPVKPGGKPFDQLEYAKSVRPAAFWREFIEPEVEFPPTCKMKSCTSKSCPICRKTSDKVFAPQCYEQEGSKSTIPGKKATERLPSHCDRIHYRADGLNGEVVEYRSWGDSEALQHSDHNMVIATFNIYSH